MIIAYALVFIIFIIVNGAIYLSALWFLRLGFKSFPRKLHFLIWPATLLAANIYVGTFLTPQQKAKQSNVMDGVVYETQSKPSHLAFIHYSSTPSTICNTLCSELLLEGQIKQATIIWDNLQSGDRHKTKRATYEVWEGDCFEHPDNLNPVNLTYAFYGYCFRAVKTPTPPSATIVLDQNMNYFYPDALGGRNSNYRNGVAIFDNTSPKERLLAIQGKYAPEIISLPITFKIFNSKGMEGAPQLDKTFTKRSLKFPENIDAISTEALSYKEKKELDIQKSAHIAERKHQLINSALGLNIDGKIDISIPQKPHPSDAARMIRTVFESGKRSNIDVASKFSTTYEGFPFLDLMQDLATGEKTRSAFQAQGYIDRWTRIHAPEQYKQDIADRKKKREEDKKKLQIKNAKQFCELESRRDGRDCSKYEISSD